MDLHDGSSDVLKQLDELLSANNQSWLFGAGTSIDSGIPLMGPLTRRVIAMAAGSEDEEALKAITDELDDGCHVEHMLSHIADRKTIAERCKVKSVTFGEQIFSLNDLDNFHRRLLRSIAETIRWGYVEGEGAKLHERIGTAENSIVTIDKQVRLMRSIFVQRQMNVGERRNPVRFFTTNYDTLIEDALAMECVPYWDGFEGGAVGFRSVRFGDLDPKGPFRAHVIKLHGSIDWHLGSDGKVWRVRDSDRYPEKTSRVLIYPQSSKYIATQRDPFAAQFDMLRRTLNADRENTLAICGYSFGDEHINQEIELAMEKPANKTTILAFASSANLVLKAWADEPWSRRLYLVTGSGIFVGNEGPFAPPSEGSFHDWWKLEGVIQMLENGPEGCHA